MHKIIEYFDKHDIFYMATAGTAVGALRHSGQIPWDLDVDIAMVYDDFMSLLENSDFMSFCKLHNLYFRMLKNGNGNFGYVSHSLNERFGGDVFIYRWI